MRDAGYPAVTAFIVRRFAASALLLLLVLTATFVLVRLAPGDPIDMLMPMDQIVSEAYRQETAARLGLDRPLIEQYVRWLGATVRFDWGVSFSDGRPVRAKIGEALPRTAILVFGVLLVRYGVGITLGAWAAARQGTWVDRSIRQGTLVLFALPTFYLGYLAIELFSVRLGWTPTGGIRGDDPTPNAVLGLLEIAKHLVLPAVVAGLSTCGRIVRLIRGGLLDVLNQDYIRAARARGLSARRVLWRHALPNVLAPVIQRLGVGLPLLLSGMAITESVFAWPGLGLLVLRAYAEFDYPTILAATATSGFLVVLGTLLADLVHAAVDPRVRDAIHG